MASRRIPSSSPRAPRRGAHAAIVRANPEGGLAAVPWGPIAIGVGVVGLLVWALRGSANASPITGNRGPGNTGGGSGSGTGPGTEPPGPTTPGTGNPDGASANDYGLGDMQNNVRIRQGQSMLNALRADPSMSQDVGGSSQMPVTGTWDAATAAAVADYEVASSTTAAQRATAERIRAATTPAAALPLRAEIRGALDRIVFQYHEYHAPAT